MGNDQCISSKLRPTIIGQCAIWLPTNLSLFASGYSLSFTANYKYNIWYSAAEIRQADPLTVYTSAGWLSSCRNFLSAQAVTFHTAQMHKPSHFTPVFDRRFIRGHKVSSPASVGPVSLQDIIRSHTSIIRRTHGLAEQHNAGAQWLDLILAL